MYKEFSEKPKEKQKRNRYISAEKKTELSKKAAEIRWTLKATHKGNFKDDFGIDAECFVLNDKNKTAVISKTGMASSLGMSARGSSLPRFLESKAIQECASAELLDKMSQPIKFQYHSNGAEGRIYSECHGFDVTILIDVCNTIIKADEENKLDPRQKNIAKNARSLVGACAKSGIQNLVYKLAGYDATKEEVVNAFKIFVREEAKEYEREFPNELYEEWYRLYSLPKPEKNKPWKFMHLTRDHVYKNLAKSKGRILELTQMQRLNNEEPNKKLHQFLSEVGSKALRQHLGQLLGIAQISKNKNDYEKYVDQVFGHQLLLDI